MDGFRPERLRAIRLAHGLGQEDLAARSGVAQNTISEAETGRRTPRPSTLRKFAAALGVEVGDFFKAADSPKAPRSEWEEALRKARQLQAEGRDRMEALLAAWGESRERGEEKAERREYLDEIGSLLQEAYDAESALMKAGHPDPWVEVFKANNLYSTLLHMVGDAGLSIHIRSSGETGQRVHSVDPVAA